MEKRFRYKQGNTKQQSADFLVETLHARREQHNIIKNNKRKQKFHTFRILYPQGYHLDRKRDSFTDKQKEKELALLNQPYKNVKETYLRRKVKYIN